jgi:MioC protein
MTIEHVKILVATMTGTAELVAEEISDVLTDKGLQVDTLLMDDLDETVFGDPAAVVICTSTYGQGDVPDNGQAFFEALERERPNLSAVQYVVFALGDMTYAQTFCRSGDLFDTLLTSLGARRVGDVMRHNASASSLPEDDAGDWAADWYDVLQAAGG